MRNLVKLSYGVGHVLNDLCAAMWFSYALLFYSSVVGMSDINSGIVILIGQVADALSTPLVGILSDRGVKSTSNWMFLYGKRKTWHLIGTVFVVASIPFIYSPCIGCEESAQWVQLVYYGVFVALFQFGWAAVQISHLSLVPDLTPDEHERTGLLSIRYTFTVVASMTVYLITWAALAFGSSDTNAQLTPDDHIKFQEVAYSVVIIGTVTSIIFHVFTKEKCSTIADGTAPKPKLTIAQLFAQIQLYLVAMVYMCIRLFGNLNQSLIPLYLHGVLHLSSQSLAIIPLVVYMSSFLASLVNKPLNKYVGRKPTAYIGCIIGICACIWTYFGSGEIYKTYLIYVVAALYGAASSILLVTCTAITADLIGDDIGNSAFVYGLMSFTDKLSSGAALMAIQAWKPDGQSFYYRDVLSIACGISAIVVIAFTFPIRFSSDNSESTSKSKEPV